MFDDSEFAELAGNRDDHRRGPGQTSRRWRRSPAATARPDTDGVAGEAVTFDGSGSSDIDGSVASYQWSVNGQLLAAATGPTPLLRLNDGANTVQLVVTDNVGDRSAPAAVTVTVQSSQPGPAVTIEGGNRSIPDGDDDAGRARGLPGLGDRP